MSAYVWEVEAVSTCDEHDSWALYASILSAYSAANAAMQLIDGDAVETCWTGDSFGAHGRMWTRPDGQRVMFTRVGVLP